MSGTKQSFQSLALCLCLGFFCTLGFLSGSPDPPQAQEASRFNVGREYTAAAAAPVLSPARAPKSVIPLGTAFGIRLYTDGVIVAALSELHPQDAPACCPAAEAGILPGDYLLELNGKEITGNRDLAQRITQARGEELEFRVRREEQEFTATVSPVWAEGSFKTGMWIRDSAAGIGTLSFYDPESGCFAGLGHGICDMDVNEIMRLKSGEPAPVTLCGIQKAQGYEPGLLKGYFSSDGALGSLESNRETGVYGRLDEAPAGETVPVLPRELVHTGPVEILASIDESGPRRYRAEITEIPSPDEPTRNFILRITDEELLERTGGIVQGMSGCPILQDGQLAGAITHVFTGDSAVGYGIFAQTMCEELAALDLE